MSCIGFALQIFGRQMWLGFMTVMLDGRNGLVCPAQLVLYMWMVGGVRLVAWLAHYIHLLDVGPCMRSKQKDLSSRICARTHEGVVGTRIDDNALPRLRPVVRVVGDGKLALPPGPCDKILQRARCSTVSRHIRKTTPRSMLRDAGAPQEE